MKAWKEDVKEALVVTSQEKEEVDVESAPQEKVGKEAFVHSSLCVVASWERKAFDVASKEGEKEGIGADVDATRLDRNIEVSDENDCQRQKEVQLMTDELCENDD